MRYLKPLMDQNFLEYASYVIKDRAIPDIEDGLKPVQRRILHTMNEIDDGKFNKVANIVGETMKLHPHGDAAIGSALVVMANKEYVIDKQGNFGNLLTGDPASASRYIEARLSKFALEVVFNSKTTKWQLSYDGRKKEPIHLPIKFPLLLAQGAEGIAVGLSTKILPHNFNELIDSSIKHLKGKRFKLYPDFQTGGFVDIKIYNDGNIVIKGDGSDQTTKWHSGSAYVNAKLDVRQLAIAFSGVDKVTSDTSGNFTFNESIGIGASPTLAKTQIQDGDLAIVANSADAMGIKSTDVVMPVVPMFHANAWGLSFSAPMSGCKVVMPGMNMDGESIYELLNDHKVTFTAAVPTVWLMLLQYLEANDLKLPYLERVAIGGSAVPRVMLEKFEKNYDVSVMHAWGMTEMSPLRASYMVEMKITDDDGNELPWNGKDFGHLLVRGPFIASKYMKGDGGQILDNQGFFDTGDVATIDELGFMQITDRSKDVIKSGGEWISSIELERLLRTPSPERIMHVRLAMKNGRSDNEIFSFSKI